MCVSRCDVYIELGFHVATCSFPQFCKGLAPLRVLSNWRARSCVKVEARLVSAAPLRRKLVRWKL